MQWGLGCTWDFEGRLPARRRFWVLEPSPVALSSPTPEHIDLGLGDLPATCAEVCRPGPGALAPTSGRPRPQAWPTSHPPSQSRRVTFLKWSRPRASSPCITLWPFSCPGPWTRPPATPDLGCGLPHVQVAAGPQQGSGVTVGLSEGQGAPPKQAESRGRSEAPEQGCCVCGQAWGCNPGPHNSNSSVNLQ